ncbi:MAG: hypothetical protein H0V76_09255 [Blastocatellia bacterium]|nr:hypothetical protein [Blastocatellia bacterium]
MDKTIENKFSFLSSVESEVWHSNKDPKAYEWWYFDALSDNGKEALVIVFLDNFIFSPRYNRADIGATSTERYPAVSFTYFENGQPKYRCLNEFSEDQFSAEEGSPGCRIAGNSFTFQKAEYGSGYFISVNLELSGGRKLEAHFEWLSIEAGLRAGDDVTPDHGHRWNMVAPRSDVTGRITVTGRRGGVTNVHHFRGTGYHDHKVDDRWLAKTVHDWHWGRVHYADSTAVFHRYRELGESKPETRLIVVKNGELRERSVEYEEQNYIRDKFGIRYPTRLRLISEDNIRLRVKPIKIIHSSFYFLRFLSEFTLTLRDGTPRRTTGISEFVAPKALKYRWLNWLSDVKTYKSRKSGSE